MKLLVVLSLIACGYAAKLDRTYLPPSSAATAGGSPGSLNVPVGSGFGQPAASSGFGQPAGLGPSNSPGFGKSTSGPAFGAQPSGSNGFGPSALYGQPGSPAGTLDPGFSQPAQNFGQGAQDYQRNQPQRAQAAADQNAEILRLDNQNDGETFSYSFETSNGIAAEESGVATNGVQAQGAFSYSDDEGQSFRVTYTADENGYQPQGDHLPTPHPIPEDILKSIEQNAQAAAAGTQEGAYNPDEDDSGLTPQQYNKNAPTSYGKGPSGSGSFNQPQGSEPSQLYGAPNNGGAAGSRPQSGGQGYQPQSSAQQYGAPNVGASPDRPSNGFGQPQKAPSQLYSSPSNGAGAPGVNGASPARPNSFGQNQFQPQGPSQQYGALSRPGAPGSGSSNGFTPFGTGSQPKPNQYQSPSQSGFPSAGRPQVQVQVQSGQAQDDSGYQYDRPQGSSFGQGSNGRPSSQESAGQYRPQSGTSQSSGPQGSFPRPNSNNAGYPSGPAQGSFGPSSSPNSLVGYGPNPNKIGPSSGSNGPGSFGPSAGPTGQGSYGPSSGPKGPSSFGPSAGLAGQGSYGPSSGPKGPTSFGPSAGPAGQGSYGPSSGPKGPSSFGPSSGSNGPSSFGPSSGSNGPSSFGPSSSANGFGRPQSSFPGAGSQGSMPDSGYAYNRPGSQQPQGGSNVPSSRPGQDFGGPRQPPSFNEEEGYKY